VWSIQQPAQVAATSRIVADTFAQLRSAALHIAAVRTRDAGRYQCEARNEKGVTTESVWLDVYGKEQRFYPKLFTVLPHIHPLIHRQWCQPCKVTTNTSGAGRVRWCLAQGHLHT